MFIAHKWDERYQLWSNPLGYVPIGDLFKGGQLFDLLVFLFVVNVEPFVFGYYQYRFTFYLLLYDCISLLALTCVKKE